MAGPSWAMISDKEGERNDDDESYVEVEEKENEARVDRVARSKQEEMSEVLGASIAKLLIH